MRSVTRPSSFVRKVISWPFEVVPTDKKRSVMKYMASIRGSVASTERLSLKAEFRAFRASTANSSSSSYGIIRATSSDFPALSALIRSDPYCPSSWASCPTKLKTFITNILSPLRTVDREGLVNRSRAFARPPVIKPSAAQTHSVSRTRKPSRGFVETRPARRVTAPGGKVGERGLTRSLSLGKKPDGPRNCFNNCGYIYSYPNFSPAVHNHVPTGQRRRDRLRFTTARMNGGLPLLHPYRRGARYHGSLAPQPFVKGAVPAYPVTCIYFCRVSGASRGMDSTTKGFTQSRNLEVCGAVSLANLRAQGAGVVNLFLGAGDRDYSAPAPVYRDTPRRASPPFLRHRQREGSGSRASYFPHDREYQNRNVSHLNLLSGSAPTPPSVVTNMTGRFFRCRNSLSDFRKNISETEK